MMSALAGIDQALWDIKGKTLNVPVHELLGGSVRAKLKVYRWCGGDNNLPEEAAAEALNVIKTTNYKQIKMNATPAMGYLDEEKVIQASVDRMAAVRAAVGPEIGIGLDFHGRVKAPMCKRMMEALEPFKPLFFEEPVCSHQNKQLKSLAESTKIPIATGERMTNIHEFRDLFEMRCVSIIQPDVSHCGGISHMFNIAKMAESYDVGLAPHCPLGPIALASCMQVDSCCVNFVFQETAQGIHYNVEGGADLLDYLTEESRKDFDVDAEGFIKLLSKPGLGIEVDEEKVRQMSAKGHDWCDREWYLKDGTPTTW